MDKPYRKIEFNIGSSVEDEFVIEIEKYYLKAGKP